jgi:hypothetical protein
LQPQPALQNGSIPVLPVAPPAPAPAPVVGPVVVPKETDKNTKVEQAPTPAKNDSSLPVAPKTEEK